MVTFRNKHSKQDNCSSMFEDRLFAENELEDEAEDHLKDMTMDDLLEF
jgi:hypothetical protein